MRYRFLIVICFVLTSFYFSLFSFASTQSKIIVSCDKKLGDSSQIGDFLGAGGALYYVSPSSKDPVVKAWQKLKFRHIAFETLHAENPNDRWITVSRNEDGEIQIDFTEYDKYIKSYLTHLRSSPFVYLGAVPRVLSSHPKEDDYFVYMPSGLDEWRDFVFKVVRHNVEKFGLRGLYYSGLGEPDNINSWKGKGGTDSLQILRDHIELYAVTYHAVKRADPTAKVGGPAATRFTLTDWLKGLRQFNQQAGRDYRVGLDFVSWQDYDSAGESLSGGADAVSHYLSENGFDPDTPKLLTGFKTTQHASTILYNIIREFKDPRQRKFTLALYHTFYPPTSATDLWRTSGEMSPEPLLRRTDLAEARRAKAGFKGTSGLPEELHYRHNGNVQGNGISDPYTPKASLVNINKDGSLYLSPRYAAFQMASALLEGDIVETVVSGSLEAVAVRVDRTQKVIVTVNNHSENKTNAVIILKNPFFKSQKVNFSIQRIDEANSNDGRGLQEPQTNVINGSDKELKVDLTLGPYSSAQLSWVRQ